MDDTPKENNDTETEVATQNKVPSNGKDPKKRKIFKECLTVFIILFVLVLIIGFSSENNSSSNQTNNTGSSGSVQSTQSSTASTNGSEDQESNTAVVDKTKLKTSIDSANKLSSDDYTDDSWRSFQIVLQSANEAYSNNESTQDDVDTAKTNLDNAISGLVIRPFDPNDYATVDYKTIARTPDDYEGKKIAFTGKVVQVLEGTSETDLRIATDGEYDDVILVDFDPTIMGGTHILEDDNVSIYGISKGLYTYQSTMGGDITVPLLVADKIVIN
jgi:hypothetical protein